MLARCAGAVEPRPIAERAWHEFFRGQTRLAEIAARNAIAADEQFAGDADRRRFLPVVEHVDLRVPGR